MNNKHNLPSKSKPLANLSHKAVKGFTIIELVLVIVLMGILAVTVAPKMFGSDGFEEYSYQAELIAFLRNAQLRAMQQTQAVVDGVDYGCHIIIIRSKEVTVEQSSGADNTCQTAELDLLSVLIPADKNISFLPEGASQRTFTFDSLGRPISCGTPCNIELVGGDNISVIIESEGFIHAG